MGTETNDELEINADLKKLLEYTPSKVEDKRPTLFDISGYPHYENVISNWYQFFLDSENPHGLGGLFYSSLKELVGIEDGISRGAPCKVEREHLTKKGQIDLLVYEDKDEDGSYINPIIIENKINAPLYNNLYDYYDSVKGENKILIVLALHECEEVKLKNGFKVKTHTHKGYMNIIKDNIPDYIESVDPKYFIYLQDFINNIERITMPQEIIDNMKFYFENSEKINNLLEVKKEAYKFLVDNLYHAVLSKKNDGWSWGQYLEAGEYAWFTIGDKRAIVYVILDGDNYKNFVWMDKDFQKIYKSWREDKNSNAEDYIEEIYSGELGGVEEIYSGELGSLKKIKKSEYLACANYKIKTGENELEKFGENVIDIIEKKWRPLIEAIAKYDDK